ncbi:MAG: VWA domain-containing protein [Planctomycetes bacterium]|nr:VWA domain-containing protein [Planctomycetota bacterium]
MYLKNLLAALVLAAAATPLVAQGIVARRVDIVERPRPLERAAYLNVKSHQVETVIEGQSATTTVTQTFTNVSRWQIEGEYIFPLPVNAAVSDFQMTMNGKMVKGELLEASKARGIYEDIVRRYLDPGLLEYAGRGLFKASIFPIAANSDASVKLTYTELLPYDSGLVRFNYPLQTRRYAQAAVGAVSIKVSLKSDHALRTIYSPTHSTEIVRSGDNNATVGFEAKSVQPDSDFELFFGYAQDVVAANVMSFREATDNGYFLALLTPKIKLEASDIQPKDVIAVLDTSGSMQDDGKMEQARKAVKFCINSLNEKDRFGLVTFSTDSHKWRDALCDATRENKDSAGEYLGKQEAIGGTNIEDALNHAFDLAKTADAVKRPCYILFMTDGLPTMGSTDVKMIAKAVSAKRDANVRLFTFGVGYDVNTWLLDTLAEDNRGQREYVKPKEDIEVKVSTFASKVSSPVMSDIKLTVAGAEITDTQPRNMPDLFAGNQLSVMGRYGKPGKTQLLIEGTVAGVKRAYEYTVELEATSTAKAYLPRMWAVRQVGYLMDQINLRGYSEEVKKEIVRLGTKFGIVTPYTSFLVVEDAPISGPGAPPPPRRDPGWGGSSGLGGGNGGGAMPAAAPRPAEDAHGKDAVEDSENNDARRSTESPDAAKKADDKTKGELEERARTTGLSARSAKRRESLEKQGASPAAAAEAAKEVVKTVGARSFVWSDDVWVESDLTNDELFAAETVDYLSERYFELSRDGNDNGKVLALGAEVIFRHGKKVYRIVDPARKTEKAPENK